LGIPLFQRIIIMPLPLKVWVKGEKGRNEAPLGNNERPVVYGNKLKDEP
jgi:hypothetical protein